MLLFGDADMFVSRYSPQTVAITHLFTVGFFTFVMFGALTQMLPVLAGVKIARVETVSMLSYVLLLFGTAFMVFGLFFDIKILSLWASVLLVSGFAVSTVFMLSALGKVINFTPSVKAMVLALVFGLLISLLGAHMLASYGRGSFSSLHVAFADIHSVSAILGFAGMLIVGISFHILPMFYVAPKFGEGYQKSVLWLISLGVVLWSALNIAAPSYAFSAKVLLSLLFLSFATGVYKSLHNRRRKVSDITILYWRSSVVFAIVGFVFWMLNDFMQGKYIVVASVLIGGGFILSVISAMLYKIVPFLVWFHLNAKGYMSIPTMNDMIDKKLSKVQFVLFTVSLAGFAVSYFVPAILSVFAVVFIVSMVILEYNIVAPVLIYKKTLKTKPEFDMSMFMMKAEN